ncbi:MAG: FAD-dependent oxidoreductase [Ilumatobacteraceae bacterium]
MALGSTTPIGSASRWSTTAPTGPAIRDRVFGRIDPISEGGRQYRHRHRERDPVPGNGTVRRAEGDRRRRCPDDRRHILVATGSRPVVPPIPRSRRNRLSHERHHHAARRSSPRRLGIIGGGFIAVEMGHVFAGLGSEVSIFNRSDVLLRHFGREIASGSPLSSGARRNVDLHLQHLPTKVERRGSEIVIHCAGEEIVVDQLLVATGREPNSDLVAAEEGGLSCHHHGTIEVDEHLRTRVDGVWAIGDVANSWQLKHVANHGRCRVLEHRPPRRPEACRLQGRAVGGVQQPADARRSD